MYLARVSSLTTGSPLQIKKSWMDSTTVCDTSKTRQSRHAWPWPLRTRNQTESECWKTETEIGIPARVEAETWKFARQRGSSRALGTRGLYVLWNNSAAHSHAATPASTGRPVATVALPWKLVLKRSISGEPKPAKKKVQEKTLRHRSNKLPCAVWHPHWPFMQKHLVRPHFATGFQKAIFEFGRRTEAIPASNHSSQERVKPRVDLCTCIVSTGFCFEIVCSMHRRNVDFHFFL